jgi:hypothetical protein
MKLKSLVINMTSNSWTKDYMLYQCAMLTDNIYIYIYIYVTKRNLISKSMVEVIKPQ